MIRDNTVSRFDMRALEAAAHYDGTAGLTIGKCQDAFESMGEGILGTGWGLVFDADMLTIGKANTTQGE